ncbi:MAG: ATP-binding protein [Candidatus Edwardsbacteria bacterium]|nr:ATP-binding protein [Candidatus Edwardsbacteria bacterium]MBU1577686.1 ATP-binding protein [Candidatus Edwardsbacteria bacterium]MBU2463570.1 ATP-binding protein [Candidatus Edwardsbacteria bacterium]MBU2594583.1 ATP-binding protein [Candidatus Edwardsbacteria bacterium]
MINNELKKVEDINRLIEDGVMEDRILDYKEAFPENNDDGTNNFLADISSMANCTGGVVIYGIEEEKDAKGQPTGIPKSIKGIEIENWDKVRLKYQSKINDGISPRIQGIEFEEIRYNANKSIVIVRIPQSPFAPHMITFKKRSPFYTRHTAGNQPMDVFEIGQAYMKTANAYENARLFRNERINGVHKDSYLRPIDLNGTPNIFLHIIPLFSNVVIDFTKKEIRDHCVLTPLASGVGSYRMNIDGRLIYDKDRNGCTYIQLFRDGKIEYCDNKTIFASVDKKIDIKWLERRVIDSLYKVTSLYNYLGITYPVIVFLSLLGVKEYKINAGNDYLNTDVAFDSNDLLLPELIMDKGPTDITECASLLKTTFDILWNAGDYVRCFNYDEDGKRIQ